MSRNVRLICDAFALLLLVRSADATMHVHALSTEDWDSALDYHVFHVE